MGASGVSRVSNQGYSATKPEQKPPSSEKKRSRQAGTASEVNGERKKRRRTVDPKTGQRSNAPDAIAYTKWYSKRLVDPRTGQPSNAPDAIKIAAYRQRIRTARKRAALQAETQAASLTQTSKPNNTNVAYHDDESTYASCTSTDVIDIDFSFLDAEMSDKDFERLKNSD